MKSGNVAYIMNARLPTNATNVKNSNKLWINPPKIRTGTLVIKSYREYSGSALVTRTCVPLTFYYSFITLSFDIFHFITHYCALSRCDQRFLCTNRRNPCEAREPQKPRPTGRTWGPKRHPIRFNF